MSDTDVTANNAQLVSNKSKTTAALRLCFETLGAHRFYIGKIVAELIQTQKHLSSPYLHKISAL